MDSAPASVAMIRVRAPETAFSMVFHRGTFVLLPLSEED